MATCKWLTACVPLNLANTYFVPGTPVHEKDVPCNVLFASNMRNARDTSDGRFSTSATHAFAIIQEWISTTGYSRRRVLYVTTSLQCAGVLCNERNVELEDYMSSDQAEDASILYMVRGPIRWDVEVSDGDFQGQS